MSNAATGFWSALGAVAGGVAGAYAGRYAVTMRPRVRYAHEAKPRASELEDAMVIGGATGAVVGAFIAGAVTGEDAPPQITAKT